MIEVHTGGSRTEAGSVGGLDGVVLGIVPDDGDSTLSDAEFAATPAATCTSVGGLGTVTVSGADLDRRYWVTQVSAPSGWIVNRRFARA
ncbi:hypothetical protein QRX50_36745 [Amycolatopsis carbonis]|uniref:Uncharacterized protein n=1 Tax=Amycolatopsis carbonis TaxID=715471 RepID=A0A9Y2MSR3_9PSEU|nr:hypothetical protein [Amycolatopsis sp. 2-15]WIX76931.1 hypothetical protein QRX50_36745 [Amycolatopsis sp. 2-15]